MRIIQLIATVIGLLIITGGVNNAFALQQQIQVQTNQTITCTSNADCKTKCEAIGGTWKPNPGGSTHGTCTIRGSLAEGEFMDFSPINIVSILVVAIFSFVLGRLWYKRATRATTS